MPPRVKVDEDLPEDVAAIFVVRSLPKVCNRLTIIPSLLKVHRQHCRPLANLAAIPRLFVLANAPVQRRYLCFTAYESNSAEG